MTTHQPMARHRFLYRGWQVRIQLESLRQGTAVGGHADLQFGLANAHRIDSGPQCSSGAIALQGLAARARALVDDWHLQARPR